MIRRDWAAPPGGPLAEAEVSGRRVADVGGADEKDDAARRTAALMGFIVILVLAIAGVILVRELRAKGNLEDCLMAGRRNCAPIETPLRQP
jgi:hypothetical protein